jgi:hypothetical protein
MKKIIIIILVLIFSTKCMSQTYEELQDIFFYTSKKLDAARDSLNALKRLDSVIIIQKNQLVKDSVRQRNDSLISSSFEKQVNILTGELYKQSEKPAFEFRGFYVGLSSLYKVDSNIVKSTFWESLKYDITGTFKFNILDKIDLSIGIGIPIRKENFITKANIEWRIFK